MNSYSKKIIYSLVAIIILFGCISENVLSKIETYKSPPYPISKNIDRETYDYRTKTQSTVPPTLTDVFICDLWQRMTMDLELRGISIYRVSEEDVQRALNIYLYKNWEEISGFRPWTHSNFIRSLNENQRKILAKEVVEYMSKNGVKDSFK